MEFENENPGSKTGAQESVGALSIQHSQHHLCTCAAEKSSENRSVFDEIRLKRNEAAVLSLNDAFTPSEGPDCKPLPSQKRLRKLFEYNEETGELIARCSRGSLKAGEVSGTDKDGYRRLVIDYVPYRTHRVIFKWMTGREPVGIMDHEDGDRSNNRWNNLRELSPWMNSLNRCAPATSNTGVLGVSRVKSDGKFLASICIGGTSLSLGRFTALCCAVAARKHAFGLLVGSPDNDNTGSANT